MSISKKKLILVTNLKDIVKLLRNPLDRNELLPKRKDFVFGKTSLLPSLLL